MENKLGRKSMTDFMIQAQGVATEAYKTGFTAGYDAKESETPTVSDMTIQLIDSYTDRELEELADKLNTFISHRVESSLFRSEIAGLWR